MSRGRRSLAMEGLETEEPQNASRPVGYGVIGSANPRGVFRCVLLSSHGPPARSVTPLTPYPTGRAAMRARPGLDQKQQRHSKHDCANEKTHDRESHHSAHTDTRDRQDR
jgi:hypothetical protein